MHAKVLRLQVEACSLFLVRSVSLFLLYIAILLHEYKRCLQPLMFLNNKEIITDAVEKLHVLR